MKVWKASCSKCSGTFYVNTSDIIVEAVAICSLVQLDYQTISNPTATEPCGQRIVLEFQTQFGYRDDVPHIAPPR